MCKGVKDTQHVAFAGLQDDLLYESLTVYETLYYAAMLRLPQHMDHAAKTERVETVITALGLSSCKDTIIGTSSVNAATYIKACWCSVLCAQWT
jgi:ABC-type multidrug transport system ATPase subunit